MKFTGKITRIGEVRSGLNSKTGGQWYFRDIILTAMEDYYTAQGEQKTRENKQIFTLSGEYANNFTLPEGTNVNILYYADVDDEGSYWFEHKRVIRIELSA